ncbi:hypothetical protein KEM52_005507 [Ascosphaera acerosa]|nr:hypothetical protein KEM52_005507 [Ascosphaera acerosa]
MSDAGTKEESPAQRAARLRREKREAKIREGGAARLDRITGLSSGRVPSAPSVPVPASASAETTAPPSPDSSATPPVFTPTSTASDCAQPPLDPELRRQQELVRALLRSQDGVPQPPAAAAAAAAAASPLATTGTTGRPVHPPSESTDDPGLNLLNNLLSGDPALPGAGIPGLGPDSMLGKAAAMFAANGAPGFGQGKPDAGPDPVVEKAKRTWKIVHFVFVTLIVGYFVFMIQSSMSLYASATGSAADDSGFESFGGASGSSAADTGDLAPPPPASFQNPLTVFLLGEVTLTALRGMLGERAGLSLTSLKTWSGLLGNVYRDALIVVFGLGISSLWWSPGASSDV